LLKEADKVLKKPENRRPLREGFQDTGGWQDKLVSLADAMHAKIDKTGES
jgi:hypothetical protein